MRGGHCNKHSTQNGMLETIIKNYTTERQLGRNVQISGHIYFTEIESQRNNLNRAMMNSEKKQQFALPSQFGEAVKMLLSIHTSPSAVP